MWDGVYDFGGLPKAAFRVRKRRQGHFWRSSPGVGYKAKPGVANKTDPTNGARCVQHVTITSCLFAFLSITSSYQAGQGCSQSCRPWGKKAPRRGHFSVFIHLKVMEMEIDQIPSFWWRTLYNLQIPRSQKIYLNFRFWIQRHWLREQRASLHHGSA